MGKEQLKELVKKRGFINGKATRFSNYLEKMKKGDVDRIELESRLNKFQELISEFNDIQYQILSLLESDEEIEKNEQESEQFEDFFYNIESRAKEWLIPVSKMGCSRQGLPYESKANVQLPKIVLPIFDGKYEEFNSFRETFGSLIHKREDLEDIQRFHYLKSALRGEPSKVINTLELTSENYREAWQLLQNRYDNRKIVINTHLKALFEIEKIDRESPIKLRNLVDRLLKHLKALQSLEVPVETWDLIIIYMMTQKIDQKTHRDWETECSKEELPNLDKFTKFLQNRAQVLEIVDNDKNIGIRSKIFSKGSALFTRKADIDQKQLKKCWLCDGEHRLYACKQFIKMKIEERIAAVKKLGLCFNCLQSKDHFAERCSAGSCKKCSHKHSTFLHLEKGQNASEGAQLSKIQGSSEGNINVDKEVKNCNVTCGVSQGNENQNVEILLATAVVEIEDENGNSHKGRVLLDSGSHLNFISESMLKHFEFIQRKTNCTISGIGGFMIKHVKSIWCKVNSLSEPYSCQMECLVLPKITEQLPPKEIDISDWHLPLVQLADPRFNKPGTIEC